MWEKNNGTYKNSRGQEVSLYFRSTGSSDWKYQDEVYRWVYEVMLETKWGKRHFWYCFSDQHVSSQHLCEVYLRSETLPFEAIEAYLKGDISNGLDLGAILSHVSHGVLVLGRVN